METAVEYILKSIDAKYASVKAIVDAITDLCELKQLTRNSISNFFEISNTRNDELDFISYLEWHPTEAEETECAFIYCYDNECRWETLGNTRQFIRESFPYILNDDILPDDLYANYALWFTYQELNIPYNDTFFKDGGKLGYRENLEVFKSIIEDIFYVGSYAPSDAKSFKLYHGPTFDDFHKDLKDIVATALQQMPKNCETLDLRYGDLLFLMPVSKSDYKSIYEELQDKGAFLLGDTFFLDVYYNDVEAKAATFGDLTYRYQPDITKEKGWVWSCESEDKVDQEQSTHAFGTKEECYNNMRQHALDKMKWNTEWCDVNELEDDFIGYETHFGKDTITHSSYSGLYTYKITKQD